MKNIKQDSQSAVSRFGRDKRNRLTSAEPVERSPRPRRDADSEGRTGRFAREEGGRRASYNPNFSADNRLREDRQPRGERSYSSAPRFDRNDRSDRPSRFERNDRSERDFSRDAGRDNREFGRGNRDFKPRSEQSRGGFKGQGGFKSRGENDRSYQGRDDQNRGRSGFAGRKPYRSNEERSYPKYAAKQPGEMRLNRFLAQSGLCSRREADDFITAGLVTVNGQIVTELGTKVRSTDEVKFNDSKVQGEKKVYLVLNKPKGYVTSLEDPHADKTVMELVKGACSERIYPVGRLDKNSLGLLLFTNDGDVTRQLTHPSLEKK